MRSLAFCLTVLTVFSAVALPAWGQRITGVRPPGGSTIRNLRPPGRTVTPAVNRSQWKEKVQNSADRLRAARTVTTERKLDLANKLDARQFKIDRTWQDIQDRLPREIISGSIKDRIMNRDPVANLPPGRARGILIIPGKLILVWRPLWWRPYPYFVPIPVSPGPVPICVQGSSTPVVLQSPVSNPAAPSEDPPQPDLAIILAHCPLPTVMAGQDLGPVLQVAAACLATQPVEGVAIDVFLTKDPNPAKHERQAGYSPQYSDGVLLKDGREMVSFPGNGLLNVPMTGALTIPADTPGGDYYLGVAIDAAEQVAEADETNNVQYVPVRIVASGQPTP
jgi:hypothetical protein